MKLLYTKTSPYARKARVIALEKNIPLELVDEDLQKKSQRLLDANPLGKVPTLVLDDGTTVFDSPVICQYLDGLNGQVIMIPRDIPGRFEVLKWEAFADDLTASAINLYREKVRHPQDFNKEFIAAGEAGIGRAYTYIENNLHRLQIFNLAPVAVASAIGYIHLRLPHLKVQGDVQQWFEVISKRPSMAQTIPAVQ
ncbi:MAG: glutathione S-transferase family protein [Candidatus Omnitrophica bacterium]|nr:glutathione S-transferase family protein [Candidatus Omnitrophota bacterium]